MSKMGKRPPIGGCCPPAALLMGGMIPYCTHIYYVCTSLYSPLYGPAYGGCGTPRKIFIIIYGIDIIVSILYTMDMTNNNYYMMYNLYLNGRITEGQWYTYCTELLFTMPEFIGVIQRLRFT
jgi:hypothetical protein